MSIAEPATANVRSGDILAEKYRVDRVLGQGGMGVVVLAEHIELRERVAIKFLLDEAAGNHELSERFIREARATVRIKSEHVVRVIDVGRLPSSAPYMVMEYLEGQDLAERLLAGPLRIEDAVDYIIQCCEAMHVAHRAGIVHRDLKPANLFLTQRPDGSPLIKILDFGISKVKSPEAAQLSLTHTQALMGSPLYMSPEQMRSSKDVSASADLWSLGVILHELISGDVPFSGETFPEVLVKVMSDAPPSLRALRPEVPAELEAVVRRCLEKNPADRYSSVAALAVALTPFASHSTLGLQSRLASSMTDPPATAASKGQSVALVAGARDNSAPIIVPARPVAPAVQEAADALYTRTNTAWDAQAPAAHALLAERARRRTWTLAGGSLLLLAIVTTGLLRTARQAAPGSIAPTSASSAPTLTLPAPQLAASHAAPEPRIAPVKEATPSVSPAPSPMPAGNATANDATSKQETTPAAVAPASDGAGAKGASGAEAGMAPASGEAHAAAVADDSAASGSDVAPTPPTLAAGVSARRGSSVQHAKAPRARAAAGARISGSSASAGHGSPPASSSASPPTPSAAKPRSKALSIEFK